MNAIKSKLLEALSGRDIRDVGEEALVDILVNKIKALEEGIEQLKSENAFERARLHSLQQDLVIEQRRMRTDPLYGAQGCYYFLGAEKRRYVVEIGHGYSVTLYERYKKNNWAMQQINSLIFESHDNLDEPTKRSKN